MVAKQVLSQSKTEKINRDAGGSLEGLWGTDPPQNACAGLRVGTRRLRQKKALRWHRNMITRCSSYE